MLPVLFKIGGFSIHSFGVMVALGFIVGMEYCRRVAPLKGQSAIQVLDLTFWLMVSGIIGARLLFDVVNWHLFVDNPIEALYVWKGGLVWYGGLLFATAVGMIYMRWKKMDFWATCDLVSPAVLLGLAVGRVGCYAVGDDHGRLVVSALGDLGQQLQSAGILFDELGQVTQEARDQIFAHTFEWPWWTLQFPRFSLVQKDLADLPLYPSQIVMSAYNFLIFAGLHLFAMRKKFEGQIFWLMIGCYAICRFLLEYIRGDMDRGGFWMFSTSQWISLVVVTGAIVGYTKLKSMPKLRTVTN